MPFIELEVYKAVVGGLDAAKGTTAIVHVNVNHIATMIEDKGGTGTTLYISDGSHFRIKHNLVWLLDKIKAVET